jgi:hypothetical protein
MNRMVLHLLLNTPAGGIATGKARRKTKRVTPQACPHNIFKVRQRWTY